MNNNTDSVAITKIESNLHTKKASAYTDGRLTKLSFVVTAVGLLFNLS